jgi:hypothetical protein
VARGMHGRRDVYKFWSEKLRKGDNLSTDMRISLKCILKENYRHVWTGFFEVNTAY